MVKSISGQALNPLPIADLRRRCDPSIFPFKTTETLEPLDGFMGQDRALAATRPAPEAMALLIGQTPGVRGVDGLFPPDSINGLVEARLIAMAKRRLALGEHQRDMQGDT
ncbi:MAG TPA: hypothetical protein VMQ83_08745 [Gammaproteobacteria bacterium]|nr:hypothetical protein [Gammaproteobacteria bacterium]